ncbi:MAG TPA: hypothetical protein VKI64_07705 [Acidimicrobiales bacterium]|nr:hypothetical protein [Acidimicrobiales bacterium]
MCARPGTRFGAGTALALVLLVAACGEQRDATIRGTLVTVGTVAGDPDQPTAGTVEAHAGTADGPVAGKAEAGFDGVFTIRVPAGTYFLSATVDRVLCLSDSSVTVTAEAGARLDVVCTSP